MFSTAPHGCGAQVKLEPPLLFSVHFELGLDDGNMARVSAGNILKDPASAGKVGVCDSCLCASHCVTIVD